VVRITRRAGKNRLAVLIGTVLPFAVILWWFHEPGRSLITERIVEGHVVEVKQRPTKTVNDGPSPEKRSANAAVIVVELPDGGRARVMLAKPFPEIGEPIQLKLTEYDNGDREVVPQF
jgi:hypothetical protein